MLGFTLLFVCFGLVNYFSLVQVQFACVEVWFRFISIEGQRDSVTIVSTY